MATKQFCVAGGALAGVCSSKDESKPRDALQGNYRSVTILYLCALSGLAAAQGSAHKPSAAPAVVARSGSDRLTGEMIQQVWTDLAGADIPRSDAAALRSDLIAYFQKEPAKQVEACESMAKSPPRPSIATGRATWLALALVRYKVWQTYAANQQGLRGFQSSPFGKMVLKYNPVLADSGGMIVVKTDVDCSLLLRRSGLEIRPSRAAYRRGKGAVSKKSTMGVCVPAERTAGAFEVRGTSSGGLLHDVGDNHEDARPRRRR